MAVSRARNSRSPTRCARHTRAPKNAHPSRFCRLTRMGNGTTGVAGELRGHLRVRCATRRASLSNMRLLTGHHEPRAERRRDRQTPTNGCTIPAGDPYAYASLLPVTRIGVGFVDSKPVHGDESLSMGPMHVERSGLAVAWCLKACVSRYTSIEPVA